MSDRSDEEMADVEARALGALMMTLELCSRLVSKGILAPGEGDEMFDRVLLTLEESGFPDRPTAAAHSVLSQLRDAHKLPRDHWQTPPQGLRS